LCAFIVSPLPSYLIVKSEKLSLLNSVVGYVEKDLSNRFNQFDSLIESVDFKKMERYDLTKLCVKKKWMCKSSNFLNQIIKKDLDGFDGSDDEKSSGSKSESSSDKSETESSESKEDEDEDEDDGEVSKFRLAEYGFSKMMKVDKKKIDI